MSDPHDPRNDPRNDPRPHDAAAGSGRPALDPQPAITPPPPPPGYLPPMAYAPPPAKKRGWPSWLPVGIVLSVLITSLVLNVYLMFVVGQFTQAEQVIRVGEDPTKRIVVLPIEGAIDDAMAQFVRGSLRTLRDNPPAAIVLRVASGGGGVSPSDQIWHALQTFRDDVRDDTGDDVVLVASFGGVAASGGYYVAAGADYIVCEPTCITGSIGVMAQVPTVQETLEMVGVDMVTMEATGSPLKGLANNAFRDWTDEDREVVRKLLDTAYERFVYVVDRGRTMLDEAAVRAAASGAVYTAQEALDLKLVDAIGFREDAIAEAARRIGLPADAEPHVTMLAPRAGFGLMSLLSGQRAAPASSAAASPDPAALAAQLAADPDRWAALLDELTSARLVYRAGWKP